MGGGRRNEREGVSGEGVFRAMGVEWVVRRLDGAWVRVGGVEAGCRVR